jgi:hypothetical protein
MAAFNPGQSPPLVRMPTHRAPRPACRPSALDDVAICDSSMQDLVAAVHYARKRGAGKAAGRHRAAETGKNDTMVIALARFFSW